jgi:putative dimethyl sulfoxide reductase chaperone
MMFQARVEMNSAKLPMVATSDKSASAQGRSRLFWLLAECLLSGFPDEVVSAIRRRPDDILYDPNDPLDSAWRNLGDALSNLDAATRERLAVEHTRLFSGLQEGVGPVPPYASAWRPGREAGEVALSVQHAYAAAGFADIDVAAGPQDHLAVELKFIALLAVREAEAWRQGSTGEAITRIAQQLRFLDEHLNWVPRWIESLANQTQEPVYWALTGLISAGLAQAAEDLVEADAMVP